jgi:hypothetical protein
VNGSSMDRFQTGQSVLLNVVVTWPNMYGPPSDCKEKAKVEETSLRKCIRPLVELSAPGHDELRAYLSLLVARSLSTNSSSRFPDTPL